MIVLLFSTLTSCDREKLDYGLDNDNKEEGIGKAQFSFGLSVKIPETKSDGVDVNQFLVTILNAENKPVERYTYSQMPEMIELEVGNYTVVAESPDYDFLMGDAPYYKGSQPFTIKKDQVTILENVVCTLGNIKVELIVDNSLSSILDEYQVTATFNSSTDNMSFSFDEALTNGVKYFPSLNSGEDILFIQFKGSNSTGSITKNMTYTEVKAGEYRKITFTYTEPGSNNGEAGINLDVDTNCEVVDDEGTVITVPGIETPGPEPGNGDIIISGYLFGEEPFDIDQPVVISEPNFLVVLIEAEKKIKNLFVTIDSDSSPFLSIIETMGLDKEFDLANPGELEHQLGASIDDEGLELPIKEQVEGQKEVEFDISVFTGMLLMFDDCINSFTLRVVDQDGTEEIKKLTLVVRKL